MPPWGRLCESDDARVRAAAAEAARAQGGADHVETLIRLCADPQPAVRFGAFHSLEVILGEGAKQTGYDPENPDPAALEKLRALAR